MASSSYRPIACGMYDRLTVFALRRTPVVLEISDAKSTVTATLSGRIADVYTRGTTEYLRLEEGPEVRLDQITRIEEAEA